MVSQCPDCNAIKTEDGKGRSQYVPSIGEFPNLRKEQCYTCKAKKTVAPPVHVDTPKKVKGVRSKITQEQCAFYILYKEHHKDPEAYHSPSIVDVGDVLIEELNEWVFTTWKTPTRLTDIFQDNPNLLERIAVKARAGNYYFKYRIRKGVTKADIVDPSLSHFYSLIKGA